MRALILLVLLSFASVAVAEPYYWKDNSSQTSHPSPQAACDYELYRQQVTLGRPEAYIHALTKRSGQNIFDCNIRKQSNGANYITTTIVRYGDNCDGTYNENTGICTPVDDCPPAGTKITAGVQCSLVGGNYVHTDSIVVEGCGYTSAPGGYFKAYPNYDNPASTFCMASFAATGEPASAGENNPNIPPEQTAPTPGENDEEPSCLRVDTHEFCQDPVQPNCGTRDGNPYCYGETDTCGELNGQFVCLPNGSRKCTYVNGSYECVDDKTGEKVSYDSPDHPYNGGNADGNPNNDEQAPGGVIPGEGAQGTAKGATNKSITDLQAAVEKGFDSVTDLLSGDGPSTNSSLEAPAEKGTYDLQEWDEKLEGAKADLKVAMDDFKGLLNGVNNWFINGSGGGLPCIPHAFGELCISDYESQLIGIRYVLLFVAAVLAVYIIFLRD